MSTLTTVNMLFLLAACLLGTSSTSNIFVAAHNFSLAIKEDTRRIIDVGVFGYGGGGEGKMELTIKGFFLTELDEYESTDEKIGFTLDEVSSATYARRERNYAVGMTKKENSECFIEDRVVVPKHRFIIPLQDRLHDAKELVLKQVKANGGKALSKEDESAMLRKELFEMHTTISIPDSGLYALFFYNCKKANNNKDPVHSSWSIEVSQYNIMINGEVNFLSIGDSFLPTMYFIYFLFFLAGWGLWHKEICMNETSKSHIKPIHYVMYSLIALKTISIFLDCLMLWQRKRDGHLKGAVDYLFYTFQTLRGIMLFVVVALIGTGWSFLKPFLSERDKKLLMVILPMQLIINVAMAVIDETSEGSSSWSEWAGMLRLLDVVCCCAVFLPVVWSIKTLQDSSEKDANGSKGGGKSLSRLRHFRTFYLLLVVFIYFTRVGIPFIENMVVYQHSWVPRFLYEAAALSFYCYAGSMFQPSARAQEANRHAAMEDDDVEEIDVTTVASGREELQTLKPSKKEGKGAE